MLFRSLAPHTAVTKDGNDFSKWKDEMEPRKVLIVMGNALSAFFRDLDPLQDPELVRSILEAHQNQAIADIDEAG